MNRKPITIYVLLFTYAVLLYGGVRGIGERMTNNPDSLWVGVIVMLAVLAGIVSLFFRKKWPYIYNIILLSLILVFQAPLLINNISAGNTKPGAILLLASIMAAIAALLVLFIRNTGLYFSGKERDEQEKK
jgi:cytochrome bd-type quinol oxidase subunit 2